MTIHTHLRHLFCLRWLCAWLALAFFSTPLAAQTQPTCGADVKANIIKMLEETGKSNPSDLPNMEAKLYQQYTYCMADGAQLPSSDPFFTSVKQCSGKLSSLGSLGYEEMPCCGYDPQRRTFACPIKIKQAYGFGGAPLPGSREYVLHCVANGSGVFVPVAVDSVHLSDSTLAPSWQFAVVANANSNLNLLQPMNGAARMARSILSWNLQPTSCQYRPIWGNSIDYPIRLNQ